MATGASYRAVATVLGLDHGYWRRLTLGQRLPSQQVVLRIADGLNFSDDLLAELLAVSAVRQDGRIVA